MLLRMSFSGGILIIMIAAVRFLSANRLPKKYFMMLWSVALLRLLVPVELPFRFGITVPVENAVADKMERMILSGDSLQKMTAVQTAAPEGADLSGILMRALPYVWAACAVLLLGTAVTVFAQTDQRESGIQDNDIAAVQEENDVNSGDAAQADAPAENSEESMEIDLGLIDSLVNSEEFQEYEAYGVSYDSASGELMYDGERAGFLYIMEENGGEIQMAVSLPSDVEKESETTTGICVSKDAEGNIIGVTKMEGPSVTIEDGETSVEVQDN